MQYTEISLLRKKKDTCIVKIFAQNIHHCGYTLEPPQRGGFNKYPQSMFWSKNMKNVYPSKQIKVCVWWGGGGGGYKGGVHLMDMIS